MSDTGGEYGNGTQRESAEAEVQQHSLFSVPLLSHKHGTGRGKMTAADVSDNPASQTNSLLCTVKSDICFLLVSSASSLIPIPPVSQWHDHRSEVSIS